MQFAYYHVVAQTIANVPFTPGHEMVGEVSRIYRPCSIFNLLYVVNYTLQLLLAADFFLLACVINYFVVSHLHPMK